jgi:hypothetical protein
LSKFCAASNQRISPVFSYFIEASLILFRARSIKPTKTFLV